MEDGQEAPDDQVVDPLVVLGHLVHGMPALPLGPGGDDRVVVGDLGVVHHPGQRKHIQALDVLRGGGVVGPLAHQSGDRLDVADQIAGQIARAGPGVGQRGVLLIQPLGRTQRPAGREAEAAVGLALQRGQVVEQRRPLLAL